MSVSAISNSTGGTHVNPSPHLNQFAHSPPRNNTTSPYVKNTSPWFAPSQPTPTNNTTSPPRNNTTSPNVKTTSPWFAPSQPTNNTTSPVVNQFACSPPRNSSNIASPVNQFTQQRNTSHPSGSNTPMVTSPSSGSNTGMVSVDLEGTTAEPMNVAKGNRSSPNQKVTKAKCSTPITKSKITRKPSRNNNSTFLSQIGNSASDLIKTALTNAMVGATELIGADGIFEEPKNKSNEQVTTIENNMIVSSNSNELVATIANNMIVPFNSNEQVATIANNMIVPFNSNEQVPTIDNNMIDPSNSNQVANFDHDAFLWGNDTVVNTIPEEMSSPTSSKRSRCRAADPQDDRVQDKTRTLRSNKISTIIPYVAVPENTFRRRRRNIIVQKDD